jgi:hypothetical protein
MTEPLKIHLDPATEDEFRRFLSEEERLGRYDRSRTLRVPDSNGLFSKLKPYIDTDQGGLKVLEVDMGGAKASFSVVPRIEMLDGKIAGASVGIGFTLKW